MVHEIERGVDGGLDGRCPTTLGMRVTIGRQGSCGVEVDEKSGSIRE